MYNKILIRYGELSLKGKNKISFIQQLKINMNKIHNLFPITTFDRMYLNYSDKNMESLKNVIGISSYSPVIEVNTNYEDIKKCIKQFIMDKSGTFKIKARRSWKQFSKNSYQINNEIGEFVLRNSFLTVDVKSPKYMIEIEIHKTSTYIFYRKEKGMGGFPVGINGRVLHLLSGGIDSPVAAFKLIKRGIHVDFLSFITPPQTDEMTISKIHQIIKLLSKYQGLSTLYLANYTIIMEALSMMHKQSYKITLMRRSFYRIASMITKKYDYNTFSNGENVGQVASQTLESITTIQDVTNYPILRPILTNDKLETIDLAIKIGTYQISIIEAKETCELFAPKKPVIKPTIEMAKECEKEYLDILELENKLITKIIIIKIS